MQRKMPVRYVQALDVGKWKGNFVSHDKQHTRSRTPHTQYLHHYICHKLCHNLQNKIRTSTCRRTHSSDCVPARIHWACARGADHKSDSRVIELVSENSTAFTTGLLLRPCAQGRGRERRRQTSTRARGRACVLGQEGSTWCHMAGGLRRRPGPGSWNVDGLRRAHL